VDLDADGHGDIISGSYWPGDLTWFRGKADGSFEKGQILLDAAGKKLNAGAPWKSEQSPDMDSLAASPFMIDFDADGDLDLLVGNIAGRVVLIPNEGTAKKHEFHPERRRHLEAGGSRVEVKGDAGPFMADWDGDGKADLLVGSGDGAVWLFRNEGTAAAPAFAKGTTLLTTSDLGAVPADGAPARPGRRTKVCVVDWNQDGRVDLLVGDYWSQEAAAKKLSAEETKERDELRARQKELSAAWSKRWQELQGQGKEERQDDPEFKKIQGQMTEVWQRLSVLEPRAQPRGSVWLYLRSRAEGARKDF
jgi:hypothetical protein